MKYVAMIRGVGPGNPNMHGEKLRWAFKELGFTNVRSLLASGNVLFERSTTDTSKLERKIETALPKLLNFNRDVFIRSQTDLQALVNASPFKELQAQKFGQNLSDRNFFQVIINRFTKIAVQTRR